MTVAVAPGTPAPVISSPAPAAADAGVVAPATDGVVGPSSDEGGGSEVEVARRKAREILFDGKDPEAENSEPKPAEPKPAPEPAKDEVALSKEWARVSAQETRLKTRQKEFLAEKAAVAADKEATLKAKQEHESMLNDPVGFLSKAGWSKDKIVEWIQSDGKVDPEILVKQLSEKHQREIDELRAERKRERDELEGTQRERKMAEVEGQLNDEVVAMVGSDAELAGLKRLVDKNPQKFKPFVQARVGSIIREVWRKTFNQGDNAGTNKGTVVDPRDALLYLQSELTELQLGDPGQAPAVKSANPVAVEPKPITNQATSTRSVRAVEYDESDPEQRRERARKILEGEIDE